MSRASPKHGKSRHQAPAGPTQRQLRAGELSIDRNQFIDEMTARNIGTSVHFIPIHMHSYYRDRYGNRYIDACPRGY